jgi:hypothetical protein
MFLLYERFLGLSRGEETFVFGKCYGFTHDHPWIEPPRRSFFPPSFSNSALLPLVARTLEMGLRAQIPQLYGTEYFFVRIAPIGQLKKESSSGFLKCGGRLPTSPAKVRRQRAFRSYLLYTTRHLRWMPNPRNSQHLRS